MPASAHLLTTECGGIIEKSRYGIIKSISAFLLSFSTRSYIPSVFCLFSGLGGFALAATLALASVAFIVAIADDLGVYLVATALKALVAVIVALKGDLEILGEELVKNGTDCKDGQNYRRGNCHNFEETVLLLISSAHNIYLRIKNFTPIVYHILWEMQTKN